MSDVAKALRERWRSYESAAGQQGAPNARIGLAATFTIDPLIPYLGARLLEADRRPIFVNANYNQLPRVCRNPASEFGSNLPDTIILLWRLEDLGDADDVSSIRDATDMLLSSVSVLREVFDGTIILALPPRPRAFVEGLVEFARPTPLASLWFATLVRVADLARSLRDVHTLDIEAAIAARGEGAALDPRKELLYRQPYSESLYIIFADALTRIYQARRLEPKKCIVLDCDNTLWGGIVGEDGVGGVQLSDDFPGRAYRQFQSQIAVLRRSGVFVALNTKNNPDEVWEMFDHHDAMILKRDDLSATRINWRPKSENLKEIAAELNIGLDSLVFIDDSAFEIEEVRAHAPGVTCIGVPEDIGDLPTLMREVARLFDRLVITDDDRARVVMMRQESARRDLSQKMTEAEFLASLGLEVAIHPATEAELARVTQLINKTNQFNLTTRRYTSEEVAGFIKAEDHDVYCAAVRDRFGDYGLVGVAIVRHEDTVAEFDTLLMSCRVLGRGIETALIAHAVDLARSRGVPAIRGRYLPTRKNAMVADLFARHGFSLVDGAPQEEAAADIAELTVWLRPTEPLAMPDFLSVRVTDRADLTDRPSGA